MTEGKTVTNDNRKRSRGSEKPISMISVTSERVARVMLSATGKPDPSLFTDQIVPTFP